MSERDHKAELRQAREKRLAEALRANLKRRKAPDNAASIEPRQIAPELQAARRPPSLRKP